MEYAITTKNITKKYKDFKAMDNVSINVPKGEIYGLIGKNGAGKTTIMKMITGLIFPTDGEYSIMGKKNHSTDEIGLLIENPGICANMTAYENLKIKCLFKGINSKAYIENLLKQVGLENTKKKVKNYSLGMKQRLGIALALVGDPKILILDEPINGLDPEGIVEVREVIYRLNKERNMTIVISSHLLDELAKVATMIGIIRDGKLIKEFDKKSFEENAKSIVEFEATDTEKAATILDSMDVDSYKIVNGNRVIIENAKITAEEIIKKLYEKKMVFSNVNIKKETLEDYYFTLIGGEAN